MSPQLEHTIAAVLLEVAYLAAGLLLCYFGKDMLEKGIKGSFRSDGKAVSTTFRVATSSPGLVFMLAGLTIIALAIRTQATFSQGSAPPAGGAKTEQTATPVGGAKPAQQTSLGDLAGKAVVSVFAEATIEHRFSLEQMEAARRYLAMNDHERAVLALVTAVTVNPAHLSRALKDPALGRLTADPRFEAIVRERFALPLTSGSALQTRIHPILGELGMFVVDRRDVDGGAAALTQFPTAPGREPLEATAKRLRTSLTTSPRALYRMLRKPEYGWVFDASALVDELRSGISSLEASPKPAH